jgi:hypothetical protein
MATNSASASARGSLRDRLLMSPRAQRRLTVLSALVLLAGIVAFSLAFVFKNDTTSTNSRSTSPQAAPTAKHVKPSRDAYAVAREFLQTAVRRKHLHEAYNLVAAPLKAGMSRKQWETGNNPVIPYPVNNALTADFHPITSTKNYLYFATELSATPQSGQNAYTFYIGMQKDKDGKWRVNYFEAENPYGVPNSSYGG